MVTQEALKRLSPAQREAFLEKWSYILETYKSNPLYRFHSCPVHCGDPFCNPHPKQHAWLSAKTRKVAAFSGNRFGKSASLVVKALVECLGPEHIPERLRQYQRVKGVCHGRIVGPDLQAWLHGVMLPEFRKWCPPQALKGGSFDEAWNKNERMLRFENGSFVQFMTYEMAVDKFGGAAMDFIGFDEPPPEDIHEECSMRLGRPGGLQLLYTMTPLNAEGANAAFVFREIWKKREAPEITVVKGSIHDNPHLSKDEVEAVLEGRSPDDPRRRAREHGDFLFWGGLVYPGGFEDHLVDPPREVKNLDVVVGIDPGFRNAAFIWIAFNRDNEALVFHEELIQGGVPSLFARCIRNINRRWGLTGKREPRYVFDPSYRNTQQDTGESVESLLMLEGIFGAPGMNDVEAGCLNILDRLQDSALKVSKECYGLRDEADEYHTEKTTDGKFKVHKDNDHRLDALRYALMSRLWVPSAQMKQAQRRLGLPHNPGFTPDHSRNTPVYREQELGPMGVMG